MGWFMGRSGRRIVAAVFPPPHPHSNNPYIEKLHAELVRSGVRFVSTERLSARWAEGARGHIDVVHLHWLEYIVGAPEPGVDGTIRAHVRAARFALALQRLRSAGIRIVWTVHNRRPHEQRLPALDEWLFRYTAARADALIFHARTAAESVARDLRRTLRAWIAPHPHYRDVYPLDGRSRQVQRAAYGLDESSFVYLMFGQVRPYKRIPDAVRAFRALEDVDARLIVAGAPLDDRIACEVRQEAERDKRVVSILRHIPAPEVGTLFELADAAILNHRDVFSSGALLLALSYGMPVVAPESGSARELVGPPALETFGPGGLTQALRAMRDGDQSARRRTALQAIEPCTWTNLADRVLEAYRGEAGRWIPAGRSLAG